MKLIIKPHEVIEIMSFIKNKKQLSMKTVNELVKTLDKECIKKICDVIDKKEEN